MLIDRSVTSENNNIPRLCAGELIFSTYIEEVVPPIVSTVYTSVNMTLLYYYTILHYTLYYYYCCNNNCSTKYNDAPQLSSAHIN